MDWTGVSRTEWAEVIERAVHTVAAMVALQASITAAYGPELETWLQASPTTAKAAAAVYYGHQLLAIPITPEEAYKMVLLLHYEEGFEQSPDEVVSELAALHSSLFSLKPPMAMRTFLTCAPATLGISVTPTSVAPQLPPRWLGPTSPEDCRKTE